MKFRLFILIVAIGIVFSAQRGFTEEPRQEPVAQQSAIEPDVTEPSSAAAPVATLPVGPDIFDLLSFRQTTDAHGAVEKQLKLFSETIKERFALYLRRSGKYIEMMKETLVRKGIPEDIAFLPLIESGFSTHASSRMQAVGPWQFISSTARLYSLKINWWVDERRDPVKSTLAAAEYLGDLYERFGSWNLAMAAYNAGEGKVGRALKRTNGTDFWDLMRTRHLKTETKNYVPKFIAAKIIAEDPAAFGFEDVEYDEVIAYDEVLLDGPIDIVIAAGCAGTTTEVIKELNPELTRWCTPLDVKQYTLKIPTGTKEAFIENLLRVPQDKRYSIDIYRVKKGDTLKGVAKRTGVPIKTIRALNTVNGSLKVGQLLLLPPRKA